RPVAGQGADAGQTVAAQERSDLVGAPVGSEHQRSGRAHTAARQDRHRGAEAVRPGRDRRRHRRGAARQGDRAVAGRGGPAGGGTTVPGDRLMSARAKKKPAPMSARAKKKPAPMSARAKKKPAPMSARAKKKPAPMSARAKKRAH